MLKNVLKNLSLYSLGPAITGIVTFLLLPVISNYLPPSGQGILGILETIQRYFLIIATFQIHSGIVRIYLDLDNEEEEKRYAGSVFLFLLLLNVVATVFTGVFFYFFADSLFESEELTFVPYILMKLIICFLMTVPFTARGVFYAKQEALKLFLIKLLIFVVDISCTLYLLIVHNMGVEAILWANTISSLVALPVFMYFTFKYSTFCLEWKYIKTTLAFSLPFVPATLATATYEHADRYLLQEFLSLHEVGIYTFAQKFLLPLSVIVFAIDKAFMPIYIKAKKQKETSVNLNHTINQLSVFLGLATIGLAYFATEIKIFVNVKYAASFEIISYIAIFWFLRLICFFPSAVLIYYKKTKYFLLINLIPAVVNIFLNIILIPRWGIEGAIFATITCGVLTLLVSHLFSHRLESSTFNYLKIFAQVMIVSLFCVATNYLSTDILLSIPSKLGLLLLYTILACRLFGISILQTIRDAF
ncbi:MAG: oligosaccharide flippase family protein [Proteobacteria bacterium]|nr:oligosaccharide flippase family protein [Pseudomonadota bacterium]